MQLFFANFSLIFFITVIVQKYLNLKKLLLLLIELNKLRCNCLISLFLFDSFF